MNRFRTLAAASVATFILLAACGEESTSAATVNDVEISQDDLVAELEAIGANDAYVAMQEEGGQSIFGSEEGTFDTEFVSQILRLRILYSVVDAELDERGVEAADACREAGTSLAEQSVGGAEVMAGFTEEYQEELIDRQTDIAALSAELSGYSCLLEGDDDALETYLTEHPEAFADRRCVSVIQVADQAAADAALARLAAGEDFATVATEVSTEASTAAAGGEIGCFGPGELTPELDTPTVALEAGGITAPIEFDGSLLIAHVDEVQPASLESQHRRDRRRRQRGGRRRLRGLGRGGLPRRRGRGRQPLRHLGRRGPADHPARGPVGAGDHPPGRVSPRLTVVGLGPAGPELVNAATLDAVAGVAPERRWLRTSRHPSAPVAGAVHTFDDVYDAEATFDEVYRRIVDTLLATAGDGAGRCSTPCPARPGCSSAPSTCSSPTAPPRASMWRSLPAMSFVDLAWVRLGVDPLEQGVRLVDGHRFEVAAAGERGPLLVAHCHNQRVLSDVKLAVEDEPPTRRSWCSSGWACPTRR